MDTFSFKISKNDVIWHKLFLKNITFIQSKCHKTQNFILFANPLEKLQESHLQKLSTINDGKWILSIFYCSSEFLDYIFFYNFLQLFCRNQLLRFLDTLPIKLFLLFQPFLKTLRLNTPKKAHKGKTPYRKCVLDLNLASISALVSSFLQKCPK